LLCISCGILENLDYAWLCILVLGGKGNGIILIFARLNVLRRHECNNQGSRIVFLHLNFDVYRVIILSKKLYRVMHPLV